MLDQKNKAFLKCYESFIENRAQTHEFDHVVKLLQRVEPRLICDNLNATASPGHYYDYCLVDSNYRQIEAYSPWLKSIETYFRFNPEKKKFFYQVIKDLGGAQLTMEHLRFIFPHGCALRFNHERVKDSVRKYRQNNRPAVTLHEWLRKRGEATNDDGGERVFGMVALVTFKYRALRPASEKWRESSGSDSNPTSTFGQEAVKPVYPLFYVCRYVMESNVWNASRLAADLTPIDMAEMLQRANPFAAAEPEPFCVPF